MLPPPRVGGIELSSGAVRLAAVVCATPIVPMNGLSGKATSRRPYGRTPTAAPFPRRTAVNVDTLP